MLKICALIYLIYLHNVAEAAFKDFLVEKEADLERFDNGEMNEFNDECGSARLIDEYGVNDDDIEGDDGLSTLSEVLQNSAVDTEFLVKTLKEFANNMRFKLNEQPVSEDSFHAIDEWQDGQGCSERDEYNNVNEIWSNSF